MLQHFLMKHGDHFLQIVKNLSQQLDLSLDGEATVQTATTRKVYPVPNQPKKLTPAKFDAWKMWQEDGLSIIKIAVCSFRFWGEKTICIIMCLYPCLNNCLDFLFP